MDKKKFLQEIGKSFENNVLFYTYLIPAMWLTALTERRINDPANNDDFERSTWVVFGLGGLTVVKVSQLLITIAKPNLLPYWQKAMYLIAICVTTSMTFVGNQTPGWVLAVQFGLYVGCWEGSGKVKDFKGNTFS